MAAQFPDRTSLADVNHDPPSATTLGSASHSAALSAPMPPVGQNLIRGNGPDRAFSAGIPPDGTAGKNLKVLKPYPIPCINSDEVATPGMNGWGQPKHSEPAFDPAGGPDSRIPKDVWPLPFIIPIEAKKLAGE